MKDDDAAQSVTSPRRKIQQLNHQGIKFIEARNYPRALIFFEECERELEEAAGRGGAIDRSLIIAVLNNQAVAYQRAEEQEKSASYVEAIIYNLKLYLDSQQANRPGRTLHSSQKSTRTGSLQEDVEQRQTMMVRRWELAVYQLQFAGLQSQCQMHQQALNSAKSALRSMKEFGQECVLACLVNGDVAKENVSFFKEISEMPLSFTKNQYEVLKKCFHELSRGNSQASKSLSATESSSEVNSIERFTFQELFSLTLRPVQQKVLLQGEEKISILNENYARKVLVVICSYFTIGAELEELSSQEFSQSNSIYLFGSQKQLNVQEETIEAEMYHLMALIFALRYLPSNNAFLLQLLQIYRERYNKNATASHISEEKSSNRFEKLTEKYKNYAMEKDISISIDDMSESVKKVFVQQENIEKKESKRLNELFKKEAPQMATHRSQESYFLEVPSIDSIQMSSHYTNNQQSLKGKDKNSKNKIHINSQLKASRQDIQQQYDIPAEVFTLAPPGSHRDKSSKSREGSDRSKAKNNNANKKSKSKQKSKSKAKLIQTKKIEKSPNHGSHPVIGLMTTVTDQTKRLKSKKSPNRPETRMVGSAGGQCNKWAGDGKKIAFSDQIKIKPNQFSSVKSIAQPIRMNKVKGPTKDSCIIQIDRKPTPLRSNSRTAKSKTKNSTSLKSKISSKGKKSLSKTIPSKQKIYTSIKQTVKRR